MMPALCTLAFRQISRDESPRSAWGHSELSLDVIQNCAPQRLFLPFSLCNGSGRIFS
jgi:hypothetical protein